MAATEDSSLRVSTTETSSVILTLEVEVDPKRVRKAFDRAYRDLSQFLDQVRLDVRQSYRTLKRSGESYDIQKQNVKVTKRQSLLTAYVVRALKYPPET